MAVKFLEDVGAKLINATRKEMVDAIFAASGRVVIGETVTFKQSMIDGVSNIELLKSWGCDMVTINHYNVNFPMIPGMESTQAGIEPPRRESSSLAPALTRPAARAASPVQR